MRNLFIILSLVFFCCENPVIYRMSANYFPLETKGNSWEFESESGATLLLLSSGETIEGGRECFLIERNYFPEHWYKDSKELAKYEVEYYDFGGERITLASQWIRYLELPLIEGNSWNDTLEAVKNVFGERVQRTVVSYGKVEGIELVEVQAGRFSQCYKIGVKRFRETYVNSTLLESDTTLKYEWYAPDVGLVRFDENGDVYSLVRTTIH